MITTARISSHHWLLSSEISESVTVSGWLLCLAFGHTWHIYLWQRPLHRENNISESEIILEFNLIISRCAARCNPKIGYESALEFVIRISWQLLDWKPWISEWGWKKEISEMIVMNHQKEDGQNISISWNISECQCIFYLNSVHLET